MPCDSYIYKADIYCTTCADNIMEQAVPFQDSLDSEEFPQPVFSDEADCPQHCSECAEFLENALTDDGRKYVLEQHLTNPSDITQMWMNHYRIPMPLELHYYPVNKPNTSAEAKLNNLIQQFCDDDNTGESMRIITDGFIVYLRVSRIEDK